MKLKPYEFSTKSWPPPKTMQNKETYLFGFDVDNQPYILRWETLKGSEGWCAVTLEDRYDNRAISADPRYFNPKETNRRIVLWAEAPLVAQYIASEKRKTG